MKELGRNIRLYINDTLVNCELTHTLSRAFEFLAKADRQQALSFIRRQKSGSVGITMLVNYAAQTGYKTFIQLAESGAEENFSLWDGETDSPRINFKGYIEGYTQTGDLKTLATLTANILISGDLEVLVSGSYKMKSTNIDEITVYSAETGTVPYSIRNTQTGITTSGTLEFVAPPISGGLADGLFSDAITGLTSGTKYEVTVGLSTVKEVYTQFNIPMGANDQHLFSSAAPDYLTETEIGVWGLPKTIEQCELNGTANDYSGANNNGIVKGSPAVNVLTGATLTFASTAGFTTLAGLTISSTEGTSVVSKTSDTVITVDTGGTLESILLSNGDRIYFCANVGTFAQWLQNNRKYGIAFSALTYITTNTNAFPQAKGANKYNNLAETVIAIDNVIETGVGDFILKLEFTPLKIGGNTTVGYSALFSSVEFILITKDSLNIKANGVAVENFSLTTGIVENITNLVTLQRDVGLGTYILTVVNSVNGTTVNSVNFANSPIVSGNKSIRFINIWTNFRGAGLTNMPTTVDLFKLTDSSGNVYKWTPSTSDLGQLDAMGNNLTFVGRDAYIPSAIDSSGNSTGLDVFGNALPTGYSDRFFDFQETLNFKTGVSAADETYADLPPPNVSNNEFGVEATDTTPNSKRDLIYIAAGASAPVDAEIIKYQNAVAADSLPKIIKRS